MNKIRFDNFASLNRGFDLPDDKIVVGEYPVIASTSIKAYHNQFKVKSPIVVTGRSGSLGKVQYIEQDGWPLNTSLYTKDYHGNYPKYVYYFLQTMHLEQFNAGAGIPTLNQNHLHSLKLLIHERKYQEVVANILSRYDEAIENNNKRIKLLEQMAQNLYKEWFVRFRFPGYENCEFENGIPAGWHQGRLSELLEFKRGKNITADEMEDGDVSVISAGLEPSGYHSISNVQGVSLTISSSGANAGYLSIHYEDIWAADCMFITEKNTKNIYYLYELLNNIRLVIFNQQRGAAQPHVYSKDINNLRLWIPNEELIENANKLFESFYKEIYHLQRANENLTKQRDLLLPRLMSGKLEVKEI